ncbi:MAG: apolipoprotein N-acyltransferase [Acidobacteriota bacterium]
MLVFAFPKPSLFPLAWVGLAPCLFFLTSLPSWKRVLAGHALFSLAFFGGLFYWLPAALSASGRQSAIGGFLALAGLTLLQGLLTLPFPLLTRWAARFSTDLALACAPGLWLLTEMLRSHYPLSGLPWGLLGYSQLPFLYLAQIADLGGVFLVSFLLAAVSSLIVLGFRQGSLRLQFALAVALALAFGYGVYRIHFWQPALSERLTAALVQPVIQSGAPPEHYASKYFEALPAFYQQAALQGADWVIFAQAPNPYSFGFDFYYTSFWKRQVQTYGIPLLLNGAYLEQEPGMHHPRSAFLLGPEGQEDYKVDQAQPIPWASPGSGASPGRAVTVGEVGGIRFSTLIGFEALFARPAREAVRGGANLLVNISDDSWLGDGPAPYHLFDAARMRAIEARKPLLRSSNSGLTARIDPWGRSGPGLDQFSQDVLLAEVEGTLGRSIYSIIGDWPCLLLAAASFGAALLAPRAMRGKGSS